jgi:integrase
VARGKTLWFGADGRPLLHGGLYRRQPEGELFYDFRLFGRHHKGRTGTPVESEARAWLAGLQDRLRRARQAPPPAPPVATLRELWLAWDERHRDTVSASHRRWMGDVVRLHTGAYLDQPADTLDAEALDGLRAAYLGTPGQGYLTHAGQHGLPAFVLRRHSAGGWNQVAGQLRTLLGWAHATGRLPEAPLKARKLPVSQQARSVLWPEQVGNFLAAVDTIRKVARADPFAQAGLAVRLMVGAGLRENEALNLEWDRVDWRRQVLVIAECRVLGRPVKDKDRREIPIAPWLLPVLARWHVARGRPASGLVLAGRGCPAPYPGATRKAVALGGRAVGVADLTPHGLRRTFATGLWEIGYELGQIALLLGHIDPLLTLKRYILVRPRAQAAALAALGARMGLNPPADAGALHERTQPLS